MCLTLSFSMGRSPDERYSQYFFFNQALPKVTDSRSLVEGLSVSILVDFIFWSILSLGTWNPHKEMEEALLLIFVFHRNHMKNV